jgi:serine/threonine protein kinase
MYLQDHNIIHRDLKPENILNCMVDSLGHSQTGRLRLVHLLLRENEAYFLRDSGLHIP